MVTMKTESKGKDDNERERMKRINFDFIFGITEK